MNIILAAVATAILAAPPGAPTVTADLLLAGGAIQHVQVPKPPEGVEIYLCGAKPNPVDATDPIVFCVIHTTKEPRTGAMVEKPISQWRGIDKPRFED